MYASSGAQPKGVRLIQGCTPGPGIYVDSSFRVAFKTIITPRPAGSVGYKTLESV